ncbi:MAG: hypothetical protein KKG10_02415, partial [Proteobacteria bacterium]|nr:hypothetical protein [Pseudomonadota bacterium]
NSDLNFQLHNPHFTLPYWVLIVLDNEGISNNITSHDGAYLISAFSFIINHKIRRVHGEKI